MKKESGMDGDSMKKATAFPSIPADICLRFIEQDCAT